MDEARLQYVEDFGSEFERSGGTRMVGRVLGYLMVSDPPHQTAEDLAAGLHASRGSISHATRALVDIGLIRRSRKPGTRLDIFSMEPEAWIEATRQSFRRTFVYHQLFARGLDLMKNRDAEARYALETSAAFMEFWQEQLPLIFEAWDARIHEREEKQVQGHDTEHGGNRYR